MKRYYFQAFSAAFLAELLFLLVAVLLAAGVASSAAFSRPASEHRVKESFSKYKIAYAPGKNARFGQNVDLWKRFLNKNDDMPGLPGNEATADQTDGLTIPGEQRGINKQQKHESPLMKKPKCLQSRDLLAKKVVTSSDSQPGKFRAAKYVLCCCM